MYLFTFFNMRYISEIFKIKIIQNGKKFAINFSDVKIKKIIKLNLINKVFNLNFKNINNLKKSKTIEKFYIKLNNKFKEILNDLVYLI